MLLLTSCATKKMEPVSRHSKDKDPIVNPSDIVVEGQKIADTENHSTQLESYPKEQPKLSVKVSSENKFDILPFT
mgnify:CR=1 FL=1